MYVDRNQAAQVGLSKGS